MGFDMAFDTPAPAAAPAADNALDMDFGDLTPPKSASAPAAEPLMDLGSMDFDLPSTPAAPAAPAVPALAGDDFFSLPTSTKKADPAAQDFDLSGIDLDLSPAPEATMPMDLGSMSDSSADHLEMDTKLDLAIAYQEIGDKEGARELVDEVIKGGNAEQVAKATALRVKLA